jgi:hypothetical protein
MMLLRLAVSRESSMTVPSVKDQDAYLEVFSRTIPEREITDLVIKNFANAHPELSGRDVKNLLKLAMLISDARGEPITEKLLNFVKVFKPTTDVEKNK